MYKIEETKFGIQLTFSDLIKQEEMQRWKDESVALLKKYRGKKFAVLIDMRAFKPLPAESQAIMTSGQQLYREGGMHRSCVVLADPTVSMQFKRLAKASGIYEFERYIDVKTYPQTWNQVAVKWLTEGVDPDR